MQNEGLEAHMHWTKFVLLGPLSLKRVVHSLLPKHGSTCNVTTRPHAQDVPIVQHLLLVLLPSPRQPDLMPQMTRRPVHWLAGPTEALAPQPFPRMASYIPQSEEVGGQF